MNEKRYGIIALRSLPSGLGRRRLGRSLARRLAATGGVSILALSGLLLVGLQAVSANSGTITANGSTVTATISSAGVPATFTFTGTSGEVITASAYNGTFASGCDVNLEILAPSSTEIASVGCVGTTGGFIGDTPLPGAGTYTLELLPTDNDLGSVTLALSANPANSTITVNGPTVTFTASNTGQGKNFTFKGKGGETVTVSASGGTFPSNCDLNLYLLSSSGTQLGEAGCAAQSGFIGETVLPGKGTYVVSLVPLGNSIGSNTGSLTLSLSANPANSTITVNGSTTFTATHTGQGQEFTFSGTSGETVTVSASGGTFPSNCDLNMYLVSSSGTQLGTSGCASQSGFIGETVLPGTGTYGVELVPLGNSIGSNTGKVTLSLSSDAANSTITANGAAVTFTASHTGQGRNFTFTGKAGETVTVSASGGTFPSNCDLTMYLLGSSGTQLGEAGCASQSGFIGETILPGKGTYTVELDPIGNSIGSNTGSVTLSLSSDPANSTITVNGPEVTFTSGHTGQGQNFTFSGTAGETVTLSASGGTFPGSCDIGSYILSPSGSQVAGAGCISQSGSITDAVLYGTGTYTVEVYPQANDIGTNTGSVKLSLTS
jgi:large repetitive protein